jgi:16S rRNA G527 N7-methylase RsmG
LFSAERIIDVIISWLSLISTLLILSHPLLKKRGKVLAMKGKREGEEDPSSSARERAPFRLQKAITFILPFSSFERTIFLFEKE